MMWARPKEAVRGRALPPQEQSDWYSRRGRAEIRLFKTDHQFGIRPLFLFSSLIALQIARKLRLHLVELVTALTLQAEVTIENNSSKPQ